MSLRFAAVLMLALGVWSSTAGAGTPPDSRSVVMVGHSLVNYDMPRMLEVLADDAGHTHQGGAQVLIGANLWANWDEHYEAEFDARTALASGNWDTLVLTEAIPLLNHLTWSDTFLYAGNWHGLALGANAATRTYIYETWHCTDSGTPTGCDWDDNDHIAWRQRLNEDLPRWQSIADHLNANFEGAEVTLVPAGQALGLLHDRIQAGQVPGYSSVFQLFSDNIHLTDTGNYFVALVMYATIYQRSPEGLTNDITDPWGGAYTMPDAATALLLQQIAWQAVSDYFDWAPQQDDIFISGFEQ
jgi:hypothetical protein